MKSQFRYNRRMRTNSAASGSRVLLLAGLLLKALPVGFYILGRVFSKNLFSALTVLSITSGGVILLLFLTLLCIEAHREKTRKTVKTTFCKLPLSDGEFLCQSCGNRDIGASDKTCGVCGVRFVSLR